VRAGGGEIGANQTNPGTSLKIENQERAEQFTVVAPKYLRPQSDYIVLISLANSEKPASVELQLIGGRDSDREQTEARSVLVESGELQTVKFPIGAWPEAEYILDVTAQAVDRSWHFHKEAPVLYHVKSLSILIQTDKPIYKANELVQFRALFMSESLSPLSLKEEINVTVSDARKNHVKQWTAVSSYRGLLSLELALSDEPTLGEWTIVVEARGQKMSKSFVVAQYTLPTFDVQIELPPYATYNKSQVLARVRATYTYGKPVSGHVTLTVQPLVRFAHIDTRPLEQRQYGARLEAGKADFEVDIVRDHLRQEVDFFEREIEFFALVEEDLTGRKYNRTATMLLYSKPVKIERLNRGHSDSFKPGLSQLIQYKVAYQDDTPVEDHGPPVELRYIHLNQTIGQFSLRPVGGLIEHELVVPRKIKRPPARYLGRPLEVGLGEHESTPGELNVRASYRSQTHFLGQLVAFESESGHYLQVSLPQLQRRSPFRNSVGQSGPGNSGVNVGDKLRVHLRATEPMQRVHCQGMARGNIIWAASPQANNKSEHEFEVQVERRMAPESQIVCFYVREENREIVADKAELQVAGFMGNFVKLAPSKEEAKPGDRVELDVFTKPNSLVGVLAIDQSILLLKRGNDIEWKDVLDESKRFGPSSTAAPKKGPLARKTNDLFDAAHLLLMTNNRFTGSPEAEGRSSSEGANLQSASKIVLKNELLEHEIQPPDFHLDKRASGLQTRRDFSESWLWQNGTADESGRLSFSGKLPDSITSWQVSAFALSEANGLGLSPGQLGAGKPPTTIRAFKPFFIRLNLPFSIIRGETVTIQAVVSNYLKRAVTAKVTLDNSRGEFDFVEAANSIEDEHTSNQTSQSRSVRVPANGGASVSYLIRPKRSGHTEIKMVAQSELAGDAISKKLLVRPGGQVQRFNRAFLVQLGGQSQGADESRRFERNISIQVPANAVRDSQKVQVSAVGDLLGASLANVDHLLELPTGSGEQNLMNLVPNIAIHNYLQATNRLREPQRRRALANIEAAYQRQLNYKNLDGSFSSFANQQTKGELWLTAYVLRTLKQARQIISVDPEIVREASAYVTSLGRPDGSFEPVGPVPLQQSGDQRSPVHLTAYVLVALLEGTDVVQPGQPAASDEERRVIERGLALLEQQIESSESSYELALICYAMHLARRQKQADRAYEKLWGLVQEDGEQMWWPPARTGASESDGKMLSTLQTEPESLGETEASLPRSRERPSVPPLKEPPVKSLQSAHLFTPDSLSLETTAWALLSAVHRNDLERALPVVRWLIEHQNSNGGFSSTRDTALVIEALAKFAQTTRAGEQSLDIEIVSPKVGPAGRGRVAGAIARNSVDQLHISQSNALVQQQLRLADNVTWVQIIATGSGSAVVQVSWQYNLLVSAEEPAFFLNPILDKSSTINYLQLSICTFYKAGEMSNMAVVEVELPSGYVADGEALAGLRRYKSIKRVDTEEGETKVIVYLERVTRNEEICFTIPAHRSTRVSNNKPVPVYIYDYYDPRKAARIFYEPQLASSCDICEPDTCSEQCSSKPKKTARLISLHEQRGLTAPLGARSTSDQISEGPNSRLRLDSTPERGSEAIRNRSELTLPSASELLPLKLDSIEAVYHKQAV